MKKTISFNDFCDEFVNMGRDNNFSYFGKKALFDYIEDLEEYGEEWELDVIALCCDFCEYSSLEEIAQNYWDMQELEGYNKDLGDSDEQSEEWREEAIEWLNDRTEVITWSANNFGTVESGFIIKCF